MQNINRVRVAELTTEQQLNIIAKQYACLFNAFQAVCPAGVNAQDKTANQLAKTINRGQ